MSPVQYFIKQIKHARHTLVNMLKEGIHPKKLAWSVTCGIVIGLFPVLFATTVLSLAVSLVFRLNIIAVQLVNWMMTPLHLLCLIPFLKAGEWLAGAKESGLTVENLQHQFVSGFWDGITLVLNSQLLAILAWSVVAMPLTLVVYSLFHRIFKLYLGK